MGLSSEKGHFSEDLTLEWRPEGMWEGPWTLGFRVFQAEGWATGWGDRALARDLRTGLHPGKGLPGIQQRMS